MEKLSLINNYVTPGLYVVVITFMILEGLLLMYMKKPVNHKGGVISAISGGLAFGGIFVANKLILFGLYYFFYNHKIFDIGMHWSIWIGLFFLYDFMFYLAHRLGHEVRFFWCLHGVHHTVEEMRLTSGIRGSLFDFIYLPFFFVWIPLLGVHPLMLFIVESISRLYGVYTHVNEHFIKKQPLLEKIFITPSAHRVHHGKNYLYLDKNYAETFCIWDRIFGTWQTETEKPVYGILKEIDSDNLLQVQFNGFRDLWHDIKHAKTWKHKIAYIFKPPGWSADGNHQTAKVLRSRALHFE